MQKVYRLLRSNRETGPYSLEELLQQSLNATDLVWIEGKSGSWAYPYELEPLQPYVAKPVLPETRQPIPALPEKAQAAERHIFVRLPEGVRRAISRKNTDPIAERAEALRQKLAALPSSTNPHNEALETRYNRGLDEAEDAYTQWYYQHKTRPQKGKKRILAVTLLSAAVLTGGYFTSQLWLQSNTSSGVVQQQDNSEETAKAPDFTVLTSNQTLADTQVNTPADSLLERQEDSPAKLVKAPATARMQPKQVLPENPAPAPADTTATASPVTAAVPEPEIKQEESAAPAPAKKRGGFLGLFRKKDREQAPTNEDGVRKAKTREATSAEPPALDRIELRSDATRDNWMLGVMGQKLTLVNHNNQAIGSASVEVSYFGEDKALLEKKTIRLNNIGPKGQATTALPDNRLAERVSFKVLSADPASQN